MLVSNRGPVTFGSDGEIRRGTGGLVTALIGLASHRDVTWIASAMSDGDVAASEENDGKPFTVTAPGGDDYRVKLVVSDPDAYDRFYNITANPMLWFIQHYLWDLSNAPDIRRNETEAFEFGYNAVNEDLARAVLEEIEGLERPVVMVHDYHLYTLPGLIRRIRPDVFLHHFVHIPWSQSDSWRVLPTVIREEIYRGILSNDIIGFHTRSYRRNFLQCCEDLMGFEVDHEAGVVYCDDREVWVRAYPLPIDCHAVEAVARRERVHEFETELLRRRRDHLILRVDRADLSKNVLRGFSGFDVFLDQHPEFRERVTFIAQLMPSRTDVPEYAEYLERIEAVVAVVNHRHGSPDWMPIQLKLRDDLEEAVAAYKHYDVLMVNAMFDGMNLVAKEGPMVNERAGVSILSENTGAHEELGEYALSVNPFDIQELADSIHAALDMPAAERARRARGLIEIVTSRDPGDWIDEQLADIKAKRAA
jgi:trehalose 6-phosphate synthase